MLSNLYRKARHAYQKMFPVKVSYSDYIQYLNDKGHDTMNVYPNQVVPIRVKSEVHYVKLVYEPNNSKTNEISITDT